MKVVQLCDTILVASEVEDLLVSDPRNVKAFTDIDPQDNTTVTDSDELRRLVNARRVVSYLRNFAGTNSFPKANLAAALSSFKNLGISGENAVRLIDNILVTASEEAYALYIRAILGGDVVDVEKVRDILVAIKDESQIIVEATTVTDEDDSNPPKRRSTRKRA